jgi:hypothetical protein
VDAPTVGMWYIDTHLQDVQSTVAPYLVYCVTEFMFGAGCKRVWLEEQLGGVYSGPGVTDDGERNDCFDQQHLE